jgi:hypothetical protein
MLNLGITAGLVPIEVREEIELTTRVLVKDVGDLLAAIWWRRSSLERWIGFTIVRITLCFWCMYEILHRLT